MSQTTHGLALWRFLRGCSRRPTLAGVQLPGRLMGAHGGVSPLPLSAGQHSVLCATVSVPVVWWFSGPIRRCAHVSHNATLPCIEQARAMPSKKKPRIVPGALPSFSTEFFNAVEASRSASWPSAVQSAKDTRPNPIAPCEQPPVVGRRGVAGNVSSGSQHTTETQVHAVGTSVTTANDPTWRKDAPHVYKQSRSSKADALAAASTIQSRQAALDAYQIDKTSACDSTSSRRRNRLACIRSAKPRGAPRTN